MSNCKDCNQPTKAYYRCFLCNKKLKKQLNKESLEVEEIKKKVSFDDVSINDVPLKIFTRDICL